MLHNIPFFLLLLFSYFILILLLSRYFEKKSKAAYQNLLQILDRAASGTMQETVYDESIDSAIISRLNRILQISCIHRQNAEKERDTIKSLISNISHQVRTPLTNIMLYTGLLKEQPLNPDAVQLASKLEKQAHKLDFFMKELVRSSYAEQEIITLHPEKTDASILIQTALQTIELAALKKGILLESEVLPVKEPGRESETLQSLYCYADKKWTAEAISNVLENAVKYSPENSTIRIQCILYESFLCIQISDHGIGIRESEQGLVFERFYRSLDVKHIAGYGIGLYLVREVLSKQGGYAKIRSRYGCGTCVQLFLSRSCTALPG